MLPFASALLAIARSGRTTASTSGYEATAFASILIITVRGFQIRSERCPKLLGHHELFKLEVLVNYAETFTKNWA